MEFVRNLLCGAVMGIAEIIPGVSGGTMAVLLNIYDKLIGSISHIREQFRKSVLYLLPIVLGMGLALVALSHVISPLLENYPMQVNFLFIGLVTGIIPMLLRRARAGCVRPAATVPFFVMLAVMILLACFYAVTNSGVILTMDFGTFIRFAAVGFLAAVCLMLPGISGSMIMVIFGTYASVIAAITRMDLLMLLPVAIGILCGLLFGAKAIDHCMHHYPQATYFAILGLVSGSVISLAQRALLPEASGKVFTLPGAGGMAASLVLLAAGVGVSLFFTSERMMHLNEDSAEALPEE
ncbi:MULTISPECIES: DUF368 domain-containing protein [Caproicibacterium]|uniref:DUF368 domain-containing protein n=1 Tax=Caproicibacterium argilliputei TaxID=3030016 RepID=A0AA97DB61_9FIRM|nr:DUF368 domain-containing protein [Caproicibacterium argilliputei]WOC32549.1 DUF368 domain-containing protein [Caproicibacterium argilliputei]